MPTSRPHGNFVMSVSWNSKISQKQPKCTVKMTNMNMSLCNWPKVRWSQPENAPKAFSFRPPPGPAWGAYGSIPPDIWLNLREGGKTGGERKDTERRGGAGGWRRRRAAERMGGGREKRDKKGKEEGNLAPPTVISKSRRLVGCVSIWVESSMADWRRLRCVSAFSRVYPVSCILCVILWLIVLFYTK